MVSIDKALIATGATADVYAWDDNRVLKLFIAKFPQEAVEHEYTIAKHIAAANVRTPAALDLIDVEDRTGIVYERVYGEELEAKMLKNMLRVPLYMRQMAETLAQLHRAKIDVELPLMREKYLNRLKSAPLLSDDRKGRLIQYFKHLPEGDAVCHGDYHIKNVMITDSGAVIIDWPDAVRGYPLADVARTYVILSEDHREALPMAMRWLYPFFTAWMLRHYVTNYLTITQHTWQEVEAWVPIMAALRLREASAKQDQLLGMIDKTMHKLSI